MFEIVLYARPGCHLCAETRATLEAILTERTDRGLVAPRIIERDISTDPAWERAFFAEIPVVEVGDRRLTLAISPRGLQRFLDDVLGPVLAS